MADAKRTAAPAAYAPIERALRAIETGATDRWVAGQLEAVDHPSAQRAVALLRAGRWRAATNELEFALEELAGAPDGSALGWFKPSTEQARDERKRPW
jgi:hypothetical protein